MLIRLIQTTIPLHHSIATSVRKLWKKSKMIKTMMMNILLKVFHMFATFALGYSPQEIQDGRTVLMDTNAMELKILLKPM